MKNFEKKKKELDLITTIKRTQKSYGVDACLMSSIRAVPILGDMISTATSKAIDDFQEKKQKELVDAILNDDEIITFEKFDNVEFLINFAKTMDAVKRLATNDKIKYFSNLLKNGYFRESLIDNSRFEEYYNILMTLSYREISIIYELNKICSNYDKTEKRRGEIFYNELENKYNISSEIGKNILYKLRGTGLCIEDQDIFSNGTGLDVEITEYGKDFITMISLLDE